MNWAQLSTLLPYLLTLACPLSMLWMMRMMADGGARAQNGSGKEDALHPSPVAARGPAEEVRASRPRVSDLEARSPEWTGRI